MSLIVAAKNLERECGLVRDQEKRERLLAEYIGLAEDLADARPPIEAVVSAAVTLTSSEILSSFQMPPWKAISDLYELTNEGLLCDAPSAKAREPLATLKAWAKVCHEATVEAYQRWLDANLPDLAGAEGVAKRIESIDWKTSRQIRGLVVSLRAARHQPPTTASQMAEIRDLIKELEVAIRSTEPPTAEAAAFQKALLEGGASMDQWTPEVEKWAQEARIWSSLRIRLDGDT